MSRLQPPYKAATITPSDANANAYLMIYVGTGGDVYIETVDGTVVPFLNVPTGQYIYCATAKVRATSTTATDLVGLY